MKADNAATPAVSYDNPERTDSTWSLDLDRITGSPDKLYAMSREYSKGLERADHDDSDDLTGDEEDRISWLLNKRDRDWLATRYAELVALHERVKAARWYHLTAMAFSRVHAMNEKYDRKNLRHLRSLDRSLANARRELRERAIQAARTHEHKARLLRKALKATS